MYVPEKGVFKLVPSKETFSSTKSSSETQGAVSRGRAKWREESFQEWTRELLRPFLKTFFAPFHPPPTDCPWVSECEGSLHIIKIQHQTSAGAGVLTQDFHEAMILGNSSYRYDLEFAGTPVDINNHLKILGICLDNKLSFKEHISIMLKKVYSKIGALRRLKRLVPANTMLLLYKSFVLSHFEYCNSLLMGIGKTLNKKLEDANYYGLRTIMNMGKSTDYESILRMADMNTLEHRRIEQSLMIFFKCFRENGPGYVANLFKSRVTPYNLRSNGLNVVQTSYNSRFLHGSYAYMISHIWNQLPSAVKNAPNASSFRRLLTKLNFNGCQCSNCL